MWYPWTFWRLTRECLKKEAWFYDCKEKGRPYSFPHWDIKTASLFKSVSLHSNSFQAFKGVKWAWFPLKREERERKRKRAHGLETRKFFVRTPDRQKGSGKNEREREKDLIRSDGPCLLNTYGKTPSLRLLAKRAYVSWTFLNLLSSRGHEIC